jgi:osmotically-inducible protein OsmY
MNREDMEIKLAVLRDIMGDARNAGAAFGVHVAGGVVTLAGKVGSFGAKMAAQDAARRVPGVIEVRNRLEFGMGEGARQSDAGIARAVGEALEMHSASGEKGISLAVSAGWVTLEGTMDDWKCRGDAENAVRRLPGVVGVVNKVGIRSASATATAKQSGERPEAVEP